MKFALVLSLALLAGLSSAQNLDPFDFHCADIVLLQAKPIQAELGISEAQRAKLNDAAATHRTRLTTYDAQQKAAKVKDTNAQAQAKLKVYFDELKKNVSVSLSAAQLKRLRELSLQRAGLLALLDDIVAKRIGLTGEPYTNFRNAFSAGAKSAGEIERSALKPIFDKYATKKPKDDAERKTLEQQMRAELDAASKKIAPQLQKLQNDTQTKLVGYLTPAQKSAWQALLGKPFKASN